MLSLIHLAAGGGNGIRLVIKGLRMIPDEEISCDPGGKGGNGDKTKKAEDQIAQYKLGVE